MIEAAGGSSPTPGAPRWTVAVLGLGGMGSRIAGRLLDMEQTVVVWNRSPAKAAPLIARGAELATSPAEAARRAQVLITMLSDPKAVSDVSEGPDGVMAGATAGLLLVEMSTIGTAALFRLATGLPDGAALVDAPVLGSLDAAAQGSLTIFVGGSPAVVERSLPLLTLLGSPMRCGPLGAGAAAKLVANAALLTTVCSLAEALSLADELGLSRDMAFRVLAVSPLGDQAKRRRESIETGHFAPRFPLRLAAKDCMLMSRSAKGRLRLLEATRACFSDADRAGNGNRDYTAVTEHILRGARRTAAATLPAAPPRRRADAATFHYDALIIDLDGVVWRAGEPIPGAIHALRVLRTLGVRLLFMTNDPSRTTETVADALNRAGLAVTRADILTAGHTIAGVLRQRSPAVSRVLVVGPPALGDDLRSVGLETTDGRRGLAVDAVVVGGHRGFDFNQLGAATVALRAGAPLYATGRDAVYPTPEGPQPATGALLAAIETAGGVAATVIGKPEPPMFRLARAALGEGASVAVVGDHLIADIAGAKRAGLDAVLVLSGVTARADVDPAPIAPDLVVDDLAGLARLAMGRE